MARTAPSELQGLSLEARRIVEGLYAGAHGSPWRGAGGEFHDYRPYVPGDAPRDIDWKLWGRSDRLFVRRFRHDTDLHVTLLVDATASMHFAGLDRRGRALTQGERPTKLRYAATLAAAIVELAVRQGDRAAAAVLADGVSDAIPPGGGAAHARRIIAMLDAVRPHFGDADLARSLRLAHAMERRRGLVVLISDALDEPGPLLNALSRWHADGFDAALLQVLTHEELDVAAAGDLRLTLVDPESRRGTAASLPSIGRDYRRLLQNHLATLRGACAAMGVDHVLMRTDEPPIRTLRRWLVMRRMAAR